MSRTYIKHETVSDLSIAMQLMTAGIMLDLGVEFTTEKLSGKDEFEYTICYYTGHRIKEKSSLTLPRKGSAVVEEVTQETNPNSAYM